MIGFLIGAAWLIVAALTEAFLGVDAEQKSLEEIAEPLSATDGGRPSKPERPRRRPGQRSIYSPRQASSILPATDTAAEGEVQLIADAVAEHGPISRSDLARRVHARSWGPGRFSRSLRAATADGRVRRSGRDRYVTS
jgi:hypothetical protein